MQGEASSLSHYPFVIFCAPERKSPVMEVETLLEDALREKKKCPAHEGEIFFRDSVSRRLSQASLQHV